MSPFLKLICGILLFLSFSVFEADFGINHMAFAAEGGGDGHDPPSKKIVINPYSLVCVLVFAGVVLALEVGAVLNSASVWKPRDVIKMFGLTVISLLAVILVAMQTGVEISAVITLLGTISGHLVTADSRNRTAPPTPSAPKALEIQALTVNVNLVDVTYVQGREDDSSTLQLLYQVAGTDADFAHSVLVVPAGQTIGPFPANSIVNVKTIATNSATSTPSSAKTITVP